VWLPPFFFVDSNRPCKDLLYPHGPNLGQKLLYLVGTILKILQFLLTLKLTVGRSCFEH